MTWEMMCMVFGGVACLIAAGDYTYKSPTVHAIYAVPSDRSYEPRYAMAMGDAITDVQQWYLEQVGETFAIAETAPQVCHLEHESDRYTGKGGWDNVMKDVQHCAPVGWLAQWDTWVVYPDVDPSCQNDNGFELGRGGSGMVILHHGDMHGISISDTETYAPCDWPERDRGGWIGGLAHELGHAFGLRHPERCYTDPRCGDKSVMWSGSYNYPDTYLLDVDRAYLREFFSNPIVRCKEQNREWCEQSWNHETAE